MSLTPQGPARLTLTDENGDVVYDGPGSITFDDVCENLRPAGEPTMEQALRLERLVSDMLTGLRDGMISMGDAVREASRALDAFREATGGAHGLRDRVTGLTPDESRDIRTEWAAALADMAAGMRSLTPEAARELMGFEVSSPPVWEERNLRSDIVQAFDIPEGVITGLEPVRTRAEYERWLDENLTRSRRSYEARERLMAETRAEFPEDPHRYGHPASDSMRWSPPEDGKEVRPWIA